MVEEALKTSSGLIEHVGSVYGERNAEFFRSIDCFLFSSQPPADRLHDRATEQVEQLVTRIGSPVKA